MNSQIVTVSLSFVNETLRIMLTFQIHGSQFPIRLLKVSIVLQKVLFFNIIQPIDLIFCKMIEIIEQNFSIVQIFYLGANSLFLARSIYSADDVTHIKSGNPKYNAKSTKVLFLFIV